jgi:hypothetical protein
MKRDESIIIMYSLLKTAVEQTEHWVAMTTTRTAKPKELDLLPVPIWFGFVSYLFIYFSVLCLNLRFCFHPTSWPVMMWLPIALSNCNPFILRSVILSFCHSVFLCVWYVNQKAGLSFFLRAGLSGVQQKNPSLCSVISCNPE